MKYDTAVVSAAKEFLREHMKGRVIYAVVKRRSTLSDRVEFYAIVRTGKHEYPLWLTGMFARVLGRRYDYRGKGLLCRGRNQDNAHATADWVRVKCGLKTPVTVIEL
jgi:hypothetical protein